MVHTLRDGRYVVHGVLGGGSQATTFDAVDKIAGRAVAIKRFDVRGARSWKDVELAEREARVLASLSHPRLPAYVEHFEEEGALYLVMDKIEGESLAAMQARGAHLDEADVHRLLEDAAAVLDYLHTRVPPIIHRDLKPGNVIRRRDGGYAFVDFGAVRDRLRPEGGSTVVGTFGFMAPEQFQGRALPGSDVYAIAATCVALLTGRQPEDLPHRGLAIDVPRALAGRDPRLVSMLSAMLDPDPDRRPTRLTPLLDPRRSAGTSSPERTRVERTSTSAKDARRADRAERKEARRAERDERNEVRRLEKAAQKAARRLDDEARRFRERSDWARHERHRGLPIFPGLAVSMALSIAIVVLAVVMRAMVPLLLTFLSLFFGRGLVRAARATSAAGARAIRKVEAARRIVHGRLVERAGDPPGASGNPVQAEPVGPRVRVKETSSETSDRRVRIGSTVDDDFEDEEADPAGQRRTR